MVDDITIIVAFLNLGGGQATSTSAKATSLANPQAAVSGDQTQNTIV